MRGFLTSAVLAIFVHTVFASLRRRARKQCGVARAQCGAVAFVQRFGDALNTNVHFHSLVLDGVYAAGPSGALRFRALPPPGDAEVGRVAGQVARRIVRLLERSGLAPDADPAEADPLPDKEPLLALLFAASVAGRIATGAHRAGRKIGICGQAPSDHPEIAEFLVRARIDSVSLSPDVALATRLRVAALEAKLARE